MALANRVAKELKSLQNDPPPGVCAWPEGDSIQRLEADVQGPQGTVYEGGVFRLSIVLPDRYPMEPPKVTFVTPIYHCNIDGDGRICLDALNLPPKGSWSPARNLSTILISIQLLLAEPNPDDGLVVELTEEYKYRRAAFDVKARQHTARHAMPKPTTGATGAEEPTAAVPAAAQAATNGASATPLSTAAAATATASMACAVASEASSGQGAPSTATARTGEEAALPPSPREQEQELAHARGGAACSSQGPAPPLTAVDTNAVPAAAGALPATAAAQCGAPTAAAAPAAAKRPGEGGLGSRLSLKRAKPQDAAAPDAGAQLQQ